MKAFTLTVVTVFTALMIWIGLSWLDIVWDNTTGNPHHSDINFFVLLGEWGVEYYGEDLYR